MEVLALSHIHIPWRRVRQCVWSELNIRHTRRWISYRNIPSAIGPFIFIITQFVCIFSHPLSSSHTSNKSPFCKRISRSSEEVSVPSSDIFCIHVIWMIQTRLASHVVLLLFPGVYWSLLWILCSLCVCSVFCLFFSHLQSTPFYMSHKPLFKYLSRKTLSWEGEVLALILPPVLLYFFTHSYIFVWADQSSLGFVLACLPQIPSISVALPFRE